MRERTVRMIFKKTILILALLASAVTVSFANPPGGGYIQCDPRNPNSPGQMYAGRLLARRSQLCRERPIC